jgi:hypothetical protein
VSLGDKVYETAFRWRLRLTGRALDPLFAIIFFLLDVSLAAKWIVWGFFQPTSRIKVRTLQEPAAEVSGMAPPADAPEPLLSLVPPTPRRAQEDVQSHPRLKA